MGAPIKSLGSILLLSWCLSGCRRYLNWAPMMPRDAGLSKTVRLAPDSISFSTIIYALICLNMAKSSYNSDPETAVREDDFSLLSNWKNMISITIFLLIMNRTEIRFCFIMKRKIVITIIFCSIWKSISLSL